MLGLMEKTTNRQCWNMLRYPEKKYLQKALETSVKLWVLHKNNLLCSTRTLSDFFRNFLLFQKSTWLMSDCQGYISNKILYDLQISAELATKARQKCALDNNVVILGVLGPICESHQPGFTKEYIKTKGPFILELGTVQFKPKQYFSHQKLEISESIFLRVKNKQ